ncbi:MAG: hypothetical protein U1E51_22995 [Candidatus Binatia bacterium]|nr:hypothetical protein [Candidatus Binatia bacterium]
MSSSFNEFYVQLWDARKRLPIDDDAGLFCVLQAGVPLKQTSYSDDTGTSLTQPATMTNGVIQFWVATGTTTVDLSVMTEGGKSYFIEGLTLSQHRIDVDPYKENYILVGAWAILSAHADGTVSAVFAPQSGGPPVGIRVKDVYVHKTSVGVGVGAGLLLDFGVSGDPDGFVDGMTASATGYFLNGPVVASNVVDGTQLRGVLLQEFGAGVSGTAAGVKGFFTRKPYMISLVTTTANLVFAITATSALTTVAGSRGYVFYEYDIIPTAGN